MSWLLAPFKGPMRYRCMNININLYFQTYLCASSHLIAAQNVPSLANMYGYIDAKFSIQFQMVY